MCKRVGPHKVGCIIGDGIEIKTSAHNAIVFGNEIVGLRPNGCYGAPIRVAGTNALIVKYSLHEINHQVSPGCCISIVDDEPLDPTSSREGAILINNIVANVKGVGTRVLDAMALATCLCFFVTTQAVSTALSKRQGG
jgi:hypothetical protein